MASSPIAKLSLKQRDRLAIGSVCVLALAAVLWGLKVYYLPGRQMQQAAADVAELTERKGIKDGDIIFQTSRSAQSRAIQLATHSGYSHCGLVFRAETGEHEWLVLEAIQPVRWTPLTAWIARGEGGHYVVKRPKATASFTPSTLRDLRAAGERYVGKDYDPFFNWDDERIYCSELVWKAYHTATGLELGTLQHLRDFDLSDPDVKAKLKARYGDGLPLDEAVISPADIFNCDQLITIAQQ